MSSKTKTLELNEAINILSVFYRSELKKCGEMRDKLLQMQNVDFEEKSNNYENISHFDFIRLNDKISRLESDLNKQEVYCNGIFNAREEFLNIV